MTEQRTITAGYGAIVTALVAFLCYVISLANGFAFDDVAVIPNDPRVVNGQLTALLASSYWNDAALSLYRPLTSLSFALDWYAGNGDPAWFHFTNILWHVAASLLTYVLLLRFFALGPALFASVLFAAHPVHVEAVANVVGRSELMAATFVLAACVLWPMLAQRSARIIVTSALYALALFCKESAAMLPALLIMYDFANGEWSAATVKPYLRRRAPELIALVLTFTIFMVIRGSILGAIAPTRLDPSLEVLHSPWHRILTALQAWPLAARLLFFPRTLLADYGPQILLPITGWNSLSVLGATIVLASVGGGIAALLTGHRAWALALLWFPIAILPVSNFIIPIGVLLAERTLYLPSVAFAFAAAGGFALLQRRQDMRHVARSIALIIPLLFAARAMVRVPEWDNTDTILIALVRDRPDAFRGQWHVARIARARDDVETALRTYDRALQLWPFREGLVKEAAAYASGHGRAAYAQNVAYYGTQRWPQTVDFHRILAGAALDRGDTAAAVAALRRGLERHAADPILNQMWQAAAVKAPR